MNTITIRTSIMNIQEMILTRQVYQLHIYYYHHMKEKEIKNSYTFHYYYHIYNVLNLQDKLNENCIGLLKQHNDYHHNDMVDP